jgi:predicted DNA-binding transcriptional regulator AlpA
MNKRRLRYHDLEARGIVKNRVTLANWIRDRGFPPGQLTGPNTRTWAEGEIDDWILTRPVAPKPVPPARRPRGRLRKAEVQTST